MNIEYLKQLRLEEFCLVLKKIVRYFPFEKCMILEIGAGSGWQARALAEQGYDVQAVDIVSSTYSAENVFPVQNYDGKYLPFPDHSFDIIFSSNVLEYVEHLETLFHEMRRVLKDDGFCIHLVPTSQWRIWTSFIHYPYIFKFIIMKVFSCFKVHKNDSAKNSLNTGLTHSWWKYIFPIRHGERGNFLSENYYFSKKFWSSVFVLNGWNILSVEKSGLFYTGYGVFDFIPTIPLRKTLSKLLGSACHIFVLKKSDQFPK